MNAFAEGIVTVALAIVGLAVVSILVAPKATTGALIQNAASGLGTDIGVAQSPVTGNSVSLNLGYATNNGYSTGFGS